MADVIYAIPLYDPVIAGNPLYIWIIMVLAIIVLFGGILFYTEVYQPMQPVWGFRKAAKARENSPEATQAIVRTMNGKIWLEPLEFVANVFKSMNLPLKWIITVPVSGQMGKVNTIDVSDDWNVVNNLDIDYAIVEVAHKWNEFVKANQIHVFVLDAEGKPVETEDLDYVYDWQSFNKKLMDGTFDKKFLNGIVLPPFRIVDMHEIRRYRPKWHAAHHSGYLNAELDDRREEDPKKEQRLIILFVAGCVAIMVVCGLGYLLLTSMKCPVCG